MRRVIIVLVLSLFMMDIPVSAQVVERVFLRDGRYLDGYVAEQIPGEEVSVMTQGQLETYAWTDIVKTVKDLFCSPENGGVREILTLKSGESLIGRILEQNIGYSLEFKLENGDVRTVSNEDLVTIESEPVLSDIPVWDQLILLDRLVLDDSSSVEGFIVCRKMDESVTILPCDNSGLQTIPLQRIAAYQKFVNEQPVDEQPVDVQPVMKERPVSEDTVSEPPVSDPVPVSVLLDDKEQELAVCTDMGYEVFVECAEPSSVPVGKEVSVKTSGLAIEGDVALYKLKSQELELVDGSKITRYVFSEDSFVETLETDRNPEYMLIKLNVKRIGYYFLSLGNTETGIVIEVYKAR